MAALSLSVKDILTEVSRVVVGSVERDCELGEDSYM
jgi:hypothetical protein